MKNSIGALLVAAGVLFGAAVQAEGLQVTTYNPQEKGIFPVSSTLITGEKEAILVDAQFGVGDGKALVEMIRASGKKLARIYITSGDPDFYFGLEPIVTAFPDAKILASSAVVKHIEHTKDAKLKYWGPILGEQSPKKIIVPSVFDESSLMLENQAIEVREMNTHNAYLWIPSIKTIVGGVLVSSGIHLWTADTQSQQARADWIAALTAAAELKPTKVIPGHYLGEAPNGDAAVLFSRDYLQRYEKLLSAKPTSTQLVDAIKKAYPQLPTDEGMVISAKVVTGEMKW